MNANKTFDKAIREIIKLSKNVKTKKEAHKIKRLVSKKYSLSTTISDSTLYIKSGLKVFTRKPSRAISGVSVVAVMTSPSKCPHGKCVFCPGGVEHMTPQSYTGEEPAALRAKRNNYDAYNQVKNRLKQYYILGQVPSKVELIIMGGTFTSRTWKYQKEFITNCFRALNKKRKGSLKEMQEYNEKAKHRCVGLTIETRPDEITKKNINRMLKLGATRVELGVQTVYNNVLKKSKRGHNVSQIVNAVKLLKNAGFKINFHMMTNMPGSDLKKDFQSFKTIFNDERFKPDMIKIYPTLLIKGTELYDLFLKKKWKPYTKNQTINLLSRIKRICPSYVRIMRVQRDIPSFKVQQDLKSTNLRQLVQKRMKEKNWICNCIRCREAGRKKSDINNARFKTIKYRASKGDEYFIEFVDNNNILFGFIRCRIPDNSKILFVRELHVYGKQVEIGKAGKVQHTGIGKKLLKKAEELAKNKKMKIIRIISGVGVRNYYKKLGYFMSKSYVDKFC